MDDIYNRESLYLAMIAAYRCILDDTGVPKDECVIINVWQIR